MAPPSGDSSSLEESWATWNPEDAEQIEPDEDILSGSDLPSSGPSTGTRISSQASGGSSLKPHPQTMDASDESISGPELIMPSIHEDYSADGSWIVHPPPTSEKKSMASSSHGQEANKLSSSKSTASKLPRRRAMDRSARSPRRPLQPSFKSANIFVKYALVGLCLAVVSYFIHGWLRSHSFQSTSAHHKWGDDNFCGATHHDMLDTYTIVERLSMDGRTSILKSSDLLQRSDDVANSLCETLLRESTGPKHELEFECQTALRAVREGIKQSESLANHIDVANLEVAACVEQSYKLLEYMTSLRDSGGLFHRLLNKYFAGISVIWPSKSPDDLLEEQFERCGDTIRHVTHSQFELTHYVLHALDQFQSSLQSIERLISLAPMYNNCGVKLRPADSTNPFVIFTRRVKEAVERVLIEPFIPPPQCVFGLSGIVKQCVMGKLRQSHNLQKEARDFLDEFMKDLNLILRNLVDTPPHGTRT